MHALNMTALDYQHYLVLGAGVTGWSVVNYLQARHQSLRVVDSRSEPPFGNEIKKCVPDENICFGSFNEEWALAHDVIVTKEAPNYRLNS